MASKIHRRQFNQSLAASSLAGSAFGFSNTLAQENRVAGLDQTTRRTAIGKNVAATVHPIASNAALTMYQNGGNAIDAAIAAALCLGVVDGHNSGLGGGCLMLIRTKGGAIHAIDGRETAPAAASETMYVRNGKPVAELSQTGSLACAVPSQIAALKLAHDKLGSLKWASLFAPAMEAAQNGYAIGNATHNAISSERENLSNDEASKAVLLNSDGSVPKIGELLRQPDLAKTLDSIAKYGPGWFYAGDFAKAAVELLRKTRRYPDACKILQTTKPSNDTAVRTKYRGNQVIGFPPPSSGGIHIAQMLNMLEYV